MSQRHPPADARIVVRAAGHLGPRGVRVVETVGAEVSGVAAGDHVVLSFDSCGSCENCRSGPPSWCETGFARNVVGRRLDGTGVIDADGAEVASRWFAQSSFATHAVATARNTVVVDKTLPLEKLGPLGCGMQTGVGTVLIALDVKPGRSVVVFGVGGVGLAAIMAAKVADASTIIAVDLHQHRLDLAVDLGATHTLDGQADDLAAQINALTGGGAHYAVDTTGSPAVMTSALNCLRIGGAAAFVGVQTGDLVVGRRALGGKRIIAGSADRHTFIPRMIELWEQGRFPFDRLIEEFPLTEINDAEQASLTGRVIKPVLLPSAH